MTYTPHDEDRMGKHDGANKKRKPFEVDKGRIVHSGAFRRLQGKTQVFGVGERDFYRTRLTHSLEVAQLGRGLAAELEGVENINQDLVETICLAHDIGHSPFGHSGEDLLHARLNEALRRRSGRDDEDGGFGANPQNLRIVTTLETKFPGYGLDLTRATLDGLIKYTEPYDPVLHKESCKFLYQDDMELFAWVKEGVDAKSAKPIEGQIADWADQLAYSVNDTEDAVRAGILNYADLQSRVGRIQQVAEKSFRQKCPTEPLPEELSLSGVTDLAKLLGDRFFIQPHIRDRKTNLKAWTSATLKELTEGCTIQMVRPQEKSDRYKYELFIPVRSKALIARLKAIASVLVFSDPRVLTLEAKGKRVMESLFSMFIKDEGLLPLDYQELIELGNFGPKERIVADFIAGMTDRYAYSYYLRLTQPGSGSFYEFV